MPYRLSRFLLFLFLKTFFWLKAEGRQNIPKDGGVIIASNHTSYLDPLAVGCACPRPIDFMARDTLFKAPLLGAWMHAVNAFDVKRESADLSAMKEGIRRLKSGRVLTVFPEGTRQANGQMGKAQAGVGFLAVKSEATVIPAFVCGTEKALPKGAKFFRPARVIVKFGQAVEIDSNKPYEDIAQDILNSIRLLAADPKSS